MDCKCTHLAEFNFSHEKCCHSSESAIQLLDQMFISPVNIFALKQRKFPSAENSAFKLSIGYFRMTDSLSKIYD